MLLSASGTLVSPLSKVYARMVKVLENRWLTIDEATVVMGVTPSYIRTLLRSQKISGQKIGGRCWLVSAKSARDFARSGTQMGRPRSA